MASPITEPQHRDRAWSGSSARSPAAWLAQGMEQVALLAALCVLGALALGIGGFVVYVATSSSKSARVYRRKWKEWQLKRKNRDRRKYSGTTAGVGAAATDMRQG